MKELMTRHGACQAASSIEAENALRGRWRMNCERGWLDVNITLAPTMPPRVQLLNVQSTLPPNGEIKKATDALLRLIARWDDKSAAALTGPAFDLEQLRRRVSAASAWGICKAGDAIGGDGSRNSVVRFTCDGGVLAARISIDPATNRLTSLDLVPTRDQRCVP
jgi:hypothetical protein